MTVVRQAELAVSPWKNGKGRKADVAEGDGWFVGLAWLEADVAFSNFPRTDRTTVLVDGAGFTLHFYGRGPCTFAVPGDRHGYAGDLPAQVKLVDGTCTVFNVMTRRGDLTHTVEVTDTLPDNGFAVVLRGSVEADGGPPVRGTCSCCRTRAPGRPICGWPSPSSRPRADLRRGHRRPSGRQMGCARRRGPRTVDDMWS